MKQFSKSIQEALGFYVYALIDPFTKNIFYVGKASSNNRALDHLKSAKNETEKQKRINEIRAKGKEPIVEVIRYGISDEKTAFDIESAIIDSIGIDNLTNIVRGHGIEKGRLTLEEIERLYGSKPINMNDIKESYIMFFITRTYNTSLSELEIYDATRQFWFKVSEATRSRLENGSFKYSIALSIYDSVVVRVYSIVEWFKAGTTLSTRKLDDYSNRWEFVGNIIENHHLLGKKIVTNKGLSLPANQLGYGYIN